MSNINPNDQEIVDKRRNPLVDDKKNDLQVTASLRDQQLEKLAKKLEDMDMGSKIYESWLRATSDRSEWLERQAEYLKHIDEFVEPIYPQALEWSSNLHLPTILTVAKTYHARMHSALLSIDPPFTVRSRTAANSDRAMLIEELMRYTLRDWANEYEGVESELDAWLWSWITKGTAFLKARWHKKFTRFMDVETEYVQDIKMVPDPETGDSVPTPTQRAVEKEVAKTEQVFNGPMLEHVPLEDVVIVGGNGDPDKADYTIQQYWLTASEMWSLVDQKLFRLEETTEAIKAGRDRIMGPDNSGVVKQVEVENSGMAAVDKYHATDRYKILESYVKVDIDGSGIASDLIVWVHANTKKILRATYLRRVNPTGKSPFFPIYFHKRFGVEYSVGLVELIFSLAKEIDAIHNIKIDVGILSSMPIGFYRPTAAALKEERLPLEPGTLIPVDNPQTDIYFPNLGVRTGFGFQEEQALQLQIDRLTSISDINLGIVGGQGAARTATGARALLGESSNNLDIYIKRMNRGWKRALRYIFSMLQYRLEPGFQFRILGDDGESYWKEVKSTEEIAGMYDFELEGNSANSNKQIQIEQANMLVQLTGNPMDLQLGIVTPAQRYEALAHNLRVNGIKDVSKYLQKPQGSMLQLTPLEIADRLLHGMDVQLNPTEDLQGFITLVQHLESDETLLGQFGPHQWQVLVSKAKEAQGMLQAMQQQQAQQSAIQQQQLNANATQQPGNMQPVQATNPPQQGEGS